MVSVYGSLKRVLGQKGREPIQVYHSMDERDAASRRYLDRLGRNQQRLYEWARRVDQEQLAQHFVNQWHRLKLLERDAVDSNSLIELCAEQLQRMIARKASGASAKLANDRKQTAKREAFELWQARRAGKHPRLRTNELFATEVMRRWPVLTSSKVICGWCTLWEREARANGNPAS